MSPQRGRESVKKMLQANYLEDGGAGEVGNHGAVRARVPEGLEPLARDETAGRTTGTARDVHNTSSPTPTASSGYDNSLSDVAVDAFPCGDEAPVIANAQHLHSTSPSTRSYSPEVVMDEAGALPQPSAPQFPEPEDADASMPGSTTVVNPGSDTDSATSTSSRKTSAGSSPRPRSSTPVRLADFLANSKIKSTRTTGTSRTSNGARPRARSSAASSTRLSHDTLPDTRSASSFASSSRVQVEHPIFDAVHPAAAANVEAGRHQGGNYGNPEGAIEAAKRALQRQLDDMEAQGREAAESAWGAEPEDAVSVHLAFGTAREGPSKWLTGLNMPLARRHDSTTPLSKLPHIDRLVVIGADGITDDLVALRDDFLSRMQPTAELCFTINQSRGKSIVVTVEDLLEGVEAHIAEEDVEDVNPQVLQLLTLMVYYGLTRRVGQSEAAKRNGGELHRKRRTTRQRPKARRGAYEGHSGASCDSGEESEDAPAPRRKFARTFEHSQPQHWHLYERCGLNDCPFVNLPKLLPQHRRGDFCWGRCPEGCDILTGGALGKRAHIAAEHPERALCDLDTCPMSYAVGRSQARNLQNHGDQHRQGSYWPYGLQSRNRWVTLEQALTRPLWDGSEG
ncbi:hypothetical protein NBRC10512_002635 [Rhodotorula toruloides]|uniref:Uncharacterized protein n=1 Tax=Rhodotorula toruloides (strain NP11) TaxID=1130832 RepID=M7WK20_RHOT1|nr:uncharacterized protein RHTO_06615 [Rhodotorula toruloides NP11]EMS18180.1 hypothetical protein RHTO_06615 [Rhodotorula toruloides NP11]